MKPMTGKGILLYLGIIFIVMPYVYLIGRPDITHPTILHENNAPMVLSGELSVHTSARRGGPYKTFFLITALNRIELNCFAPKYLECFPQSSSYVGHYILAKISMTGQNQANLLSVQDADGKIVVDEQYFQERLTQFKQDAWQITGVFNFVGAALIIIALML